MQPTRSPLRYFVIACSAVGIVAGAQGCGSADSSTFDTANPDGGGVFGDGGTVPSFGDGGVTNGGDGSTTGGPCVNLQCQQVACPAGQKTTVTGTVMDPAGKNPLYNVAVYVPNSKPSAFTDSASCDTCAALYTGNPIASALTGADGKFTLENVPVGTNIPLVIQIGKWRRQVTIPSVAQCTNTAITDANAIRLPRNRTEGDIPKIAVSTGGADTLECLFRRIGVDASEFTSGTGPERIHIYRGQGGGKAGAPEMIGGSPASEASLWKDKASLMTYDIVTLSCEGDEYGDGSDYPDGTSSGTPATKPPAALKAMKDYADSGGRIFASHFHYYWLSSGPAPFPSTATWTRGSNTIGTGSIDGKIDQSFPKGVAFAQWLKNVNALKANGNLPIVDAKHNADVNIAVNKGVQPWITNADTKNAATEYFTFNTPMGAAADAQCGRVVYSDLHVGGASNDYSNAATVPAGCSTGNLSPQEKALEFMLFDLSSCVTPDSAPPQPPPSGGPR